MRAKFEVGETVEMRCQHRQGGQLVTDWLQGQVVAVDYRMLGVRFDVDVFANNGLPIGDRTLWCTHGSPNLRRPASAIAAEASSSPAASVTEEVNTHD